MLWFVSLAVLIGGNPPLPSADVPQRYGVAWVACRNEKLDFSPDGIVAELEGCDALIAAKDVDNEIKAIAHTNRGMLMSQSSFFVTAKDEFDRAIKLNPKLAPAFYNRAFLHQNLKEFPAAIDDYSAAITVLPTMVEAYINRGIIYAQSGQSALALADFNKAIQLEPGSADLYENRAHLLRDMGRSAEADADMAKAKQLTKQ